MEGKAPKASQPVATRRSARQSVLIKNNVKNSKSSVQSSRERTSINHASNGVLTSEGQGATPSDCGKKAVPRRNSRRISVQVKEEGPDVVPEQNALNFALQQVSIEELQNWNGWCVLESEPAFFNVILREVGVSGIKIQEVLGIEEGMLELLPNPIYGLIFLYQVNETNDNGGEGESMQSDSVWFANQIANDSCASVALMNVVMNADGVHLGGELQHFKDSTKEKTPHERGEALSKFQHIRNIHNSFARKMDILSADLVLANEEAAAKSKRNGRKSKRNDEEIFEEPGYHFIAFLPVDGCLWKLDGLQPQPINLGKYVHSWMQDVQGILSRLMEKCENDGIEFSLQAVCRSPLLSLPEDLATNIANIRATEACLDALLPEWKNFSPHEHELVFVEEALWAPNKHFGLSTEMIDAAQPQDTVKLQLEDSSAGAHALMEIRKNLIGTQYSLRQSYIEEVVSMEEDSQSANGRRFDHTPFLAAWTQMLAGKGILKDLWNEAS